MSVRRKRFRIEEVNFGDMPMAADTSTEIPMHREIMTELRAIRSQMASPERNAVAEQVNAAADEQVAEAQALLAQANADDVNAVGAYIAPVEYEADGTLRPGNLREAIRYAGPTFDLPVTFGI